MALLKKSGGIMDVIRCDESDYLVWKWHPKGTESGQNKRENAIRWGSVLHVKSGEVAVFLYKKKDGVIQDYIEGPYNDVISTNNLPVISGIIGLAYNGDTPFQAEVYFINLDQVIQSPFAVPFFNVFDPRFLDFGVPVAVRGTMTYKITDYKEFVNLQRLETFSIDDLQRQVRDAVSQYTKSVVAKTPGEKNIPVLQMEREIDQISESVRSGLTGRMQSDFGVELKGLDISAIEVDQTSEGYANLKKITQDVSTATIEAQTEVQIKDLHDKQQIHAKHLEEELRLQREESHFAAHQLDQQTAVGLAGAEALGEMGKNNAMTMDGGGGMNPAAMMTGMAMGGVLGQNMAGMMNQAMNGIGQPATGQIPPIPVIGYRIAIDGQPAGPYDLPAIEKMLASGQITGESLVWKEGMPDWKQIGDISELSALLKNTPPPIPE